MTFLLTIWREKKVTKEGIHIIHSERDEKYERDEKLERGEKQENLINQILDGMSVSILSLPLMCFISKLYSKKINKLS